MKNKICILTFILLITSNLFAAEKNMEFKLTFFDGIGLSAEKSFGGDGKNYGGGILLYQDGVNKDGNKTDEYIYGFYGFLDLPLSEKWSLNFQGGLGLEKVGSESNTQILYGVEANYSINTLFDIITGYKNYNGYNLGIGIKI